MNEVLGKKLGNYRLIRLLGRGGFADVYLGEHIYLKTWAAIKVVRLRLADDALQKFLSEARMVARLDHPHIVRVLDFGLENTTPFLVMNYAPYGTLRQRHPSGTVLPVMTLLSYVRQIASALQYAHTMSIIHRDVKPENMLIGARKSVLLSDFGLAISSQNTASIEPLLSRKERMVGTASYMAPEVFEGKPSRSSDQYALAVVTYEWLCGSLPFKGSDLEIAVRHVHTAPPSLIEQMPSISPALEDVVMKALAKQPQERFPSVNDFVTALELGWQKSRTSKAANVVSLPSKEWSRESIREKKRSYSQVIVDEKMEQSTAQSASSSRTIENERERAPAVLASQEKKWRKRWTALALSFLIGLSIFIGNSFTGQPLSHPTERSRLAMSTQTGGVKVSLPALQFSPSPQRTVQSVPLPVTTLVPSPAITLTPTQQVLLTPTLGRETPTVQPSPSPSPSVESPLTVNTTQLDSSACDQSDGVYRCEVTLNLSGDFQEALHWKARSRGVRAVFAPPVGTLAPGDSILVTIYIFRGCNSEGRLIFSAGRFFAETHWQC